MLSEKITFRGGQRATVLSVTQATPAQEIVAALALPRPRAVLVLNGGTAEHAAELDASLSLALGNGAARVVAEEGITALTGGTDAGIFHLFGKGLGCWKPDAPCIGVAIHALVKLPGSNAGGVALEPHHSHFVLVRGANWGDETEIMYGLMAALAQGCPSAALFAGGGEIALREMQANVAQGRTMLLLAGSGRNTDAVLAAAAGSPSLNPDIEAIARAGRIVPVHISDGPAPLVEALRRCLLDGDAAVEGTL